MLGDVLKIDMILMQADKLGEKGDKWGAWEAVQDSLKQFPQDPELNQKARELSTDAADFVSTLKRAEKYEQDNQTGSSLAWFLKARKIYPNSSFARDGIERLIDEYLPSASTGVGTGSSRTSGGSSLGSYDTPADSLDLSTGSSLPSNPGSGGTSALDFN